MRYHAELACLFVEQEMLVVAHVVVVAGLGMGDVALEHGRGIEFGRAVRRAHRRRSVRRVCRPCDSRAKRWRWRAWLYYL